VTRESCLRAGMNGFLSKPIARADLIRAKGGSRRAE
jgi:CheY-like chemotaxis protein